MSEIIFRLINDGKVVGYEKHEGGRIYHCQPCADNKYLPFAEMDILTLHFDNGKEWYHPYYIPHTRKDRWTGLKYDSGRLMFERDKTEDEHGEKGTVLYYEGEAQFRVFIEGLGSYEISDIKGLTFLGIEGVDDKGEK